MPSEGNERTKKPFRLIYLDQDDVLARFSDAARQALNDATEKQLSSEYLAENSEDHGDMPRLWGITEERFWSILENTPHFWLELKPYRWAGYLYEASKDFADRVKIVTSPPQFPPGYGHKVIWLQRWLSVPFADITLMHDKEELADPDRLLVDDRPSNVDAFREKGGHGAAVPAEWNDANVTFEKVWTEIYRRMLETGKEGFEAPAKK